MTEMNITKVGEDRYHVVIDDSFTTIDEDVNDSQLQGMLAAKKLAGTTCDEVLAFLDPQDIGYQTSIAYE